MPPSLWPARRTRPENWGRRCPAEDAMLQPKFNLYVDGESLFTRTEAVLKKQLGVEAVGLHAVTLRNNRGLGTSGWPFTPETRLTTKTAAKILLDTLFGALPRWAHPKTYIQR